jgi:hypothetical protein
VPDTALDELNELDEALVTAVESGDTDAFTRALDELLAGVRAAATPHATDALDSSDLIPAGARFVAGRGPGAAGRRRPHPGVR